MKLRAAWAPQVSTGAVKCRRCRLPIDPQQPWHLGHIEDRGTGGSDDPANLHPEHVRCNTSAGGKLAQALRKTPTIPANPTQNRRTW
jgi:hypothetical protein